MAWYEPYKGGWRARWRSGTSKPAGPKCATEAEAKRWAVLNGHEQANDPTLTFVLDEWARGRAAEHSIAPTYIREVQADLTALFTNQKWARVSDLTYPAVHQWQLDAKGVNVRRPLAYLLSVLRWCRKPLGLTIDQDLLLWRFPRRRRGAPKRGLIDYPQMKLVLEHAMGISKHVYAILHYLSIYGARPATACALTIGQVDFKRQTIRVSAKTSGGWEHPILPETAEVLAWCVGDRPSTAALFLKPFTGTGRNRTKVPSQPWALNRYGEAEQLGKWYARNLGEKYLPANVQGIYDVKRHAITMALRAGIDPVRIARWTGHRSIGQILLYGRADDAGTKAALTQLEAWRAPQLGLVALQDRERAGETPAEGSGPAPASGPGNAPGSLAGFLGQPDDSRRYDGGGADAT